MDQKFLFQVTHLDGQRLLPQVSRALERRTEVISRQKYPKMWELTDKLNSVEKVPQAVRENRSKRKGFLGFLNWMLGMFLLMSGCMDPQALMIALIVGAVGYGVGVVTLWNHRRGFLGYLSLFQGMVLCAGGWMNRAELGALLPLGIAGLVIGVAALAMRKQGERNPFDQAARLLLEGKQAQSEMEQGKVCFSPEGMTLYWGEEAQRFIPYASFEMVLETEDLLLPVYDDAVSVLQKKDLCEGTIEELRALLSGAVHYLPVEGSPGEAGRQEAPSR